MSRAQRLKPTKSAASISLSDNDIRRLVKTNIVSYPMLKQASSLDQLLGETGSLVILLLTKSQNEGHWITVFKRSPFEVEYFDSYGNSIDSSKNKWLSERRQYELGEAENTLSRLLYDSPYQLSYNEYALQSKRSKNNTCGRWVVMRLWNRDMPLEEFVRTFNEKEVVYYTDQMMQRLGGYR